MKASQIGAWGGFHFNFRQNYRDVITLLSFSDWGNYAFVSTYGRSHQVLHFGHAICLNKHKTSMRRATSTSDQVFDSQFLTPGGPVSNRVDAFLPFLQVRATVFRGVMVLNMKSHSVLLPEKFLKSQKLYNKSASQLIYRPGCYDFQTTAGPNLHRIGVGHHCFIKKRV